MTNRDRFFVRVVAAGHDGRDTRPRYTVEITDRLTGRSRRGSPCYENDAQRMAEGAAVAIDLVQGTVRP